MPTALSDKRNIEVTHKHLPSDYAMGSLAMATDHYNIGYVVSGDRKTYLLDGYYTVHAGMATMMEPYVYHRTVSMSDEPYERYQVKYSKSIVEDLIEEIGHAKFNELNERKIFELSEEDSQVVLQIFKDMEYEYARESVHRDFVLKGLLERVIIILCESTQKSVGDADNSIAHYSRQMNKQIIDAVYYIENNYMNDLTLEMTANSVFMSKWYFSHMFKEQIGKTYSEYLNSVRLRHVEEMLIKTDKKIGQIALDTGYPNGGYLSDIFKKWRGMTPREFRAKKQ